MFEPGRRFGGYRIEGVLGRGGMGVVYAATQLSLERTVALKVLAPELGHDAAFQERFRREGLIQARIDHPHIVTVHEAGVLEDHLFLAMRLVPGGSLKDLIIGGDLDVLRLLRILTPVADALDVAHEAGLIHRDVKPHNILVGRRDHAFLADFGLTKATGERGLTRTGHFVGTPDYVSPEQLRGDDATPSSDIYALASVMYETLTGLVPYPRPTDLAVLFAHANDPPPSVTEMAPWAGGEIDAVIARGMAKDPSERPRSATELMANAARALDGVAGGPGRRDRASYAGTPILGSTADRTAQPMPLPGSTVDHDVRAAADADTLPGERRAGAPAESVPSRPPATRRDGGGSAEASAQAREPAPTRGGGAPARPRRPLALAGLAILAVTGLAATAGSIAGRDDPAAAPAPGPTLVAAGVELELPAGWRRLSAAPAIPGLALEAAVAAAGGDGVQVVAGVAPGAAGPRLAPAALLGDAEPVTVRIGQVEALRYPELELPGLDTKASLVLVPAAGGTRVIACLGASAAACDRMIAPAAFDELTTFAVGPDADYGTTARDALAKLDDARRGGGRSLGEARTPKRQAKAASALARAHRVARAALPGMVENPQVAPANARLRAALRELERAYTALGRAASESRRAAYDAARGAVRRGDGALDDALAELQEAGYRS